jgi:hypothetical protein
VALISIHIELNLPLITMRFSFSLVACLLACLAVSCCAKVSADHAGAIKTYGVCKKASENPMPGGWAFLTLDEINKDKASDNTIRVA